MRCYVILKQKKKLFALIKQKVNVADDAKIL